MMLPLIEIALVIVVTSCSFCLGVWTRVTASVHNIQHTSSVYQKKKMGLKACLGPENSAVFFIMDALVRETRRAVEVVELPVPAPALWLDDGQDGVVGWRAACGYLMPPSFWTSAARTLRVDGALDMLQSLVHDIDTTDHVGECVVRYVAQAETTFFLDGPNFLVGTRRSTADVCWAAVLTWATRHVRPETWERAPKLAALLPNLVDLAVV